MTTAELLATGAEEPAPLDLWSAPAPRCILRAQGLSTSELPLNAQGPLGILWVGIALCCFYIALVWLNMLLPMFLTPLFMIPATWVLELLNGKKPGAGGEG